MRACAALRRRPNSTRARVAGAAMRGAAPAPPRCNASMRAGLPAPGIRGHPGARPCRRRTSPARRHGASLSAARRRSLRSAVRACHSDGERSALGTDSPVSAGAFDLLAEARTAALLSGLAPPRRCAWPRSVVRRRWDCRADRLARARQGRRPPLRRSRCARVPATRRRGCCIVFGATRAQVSDVWSGGPLRRQCPTASSPSMPRSSPPAGAWAQRLKLGAAA